MKQLEEALDPLPEWLNDAILDDGHMAGDFSIIAERCDWLCDHLIEMDDDLRGVHVEAIKKARAVLATIDES